MTEGVQRAGALDILYVPVSGPKGSGEAQAALLLARAMAAANPDLKQLLLLSKHSALAGQTAVDAILLADSPARSNHAVVALIERMRPRVVVFDTSSRRAQLKAAKAVHAKTVFVCWRAKSRRRALALLKLNLWDEFWLLIPPNLDENFSFWERLKLRLLAPFTPLILGALADEADVAAARALLPVAMSRFVFLTPSGQYAVEHFRAIADALIERGASVVLSVSAAPRESAHERLVELGRLPNATLLGLLELSERSLINGGSLLLQAAALGIKPLAMPLVRDQHARVAAMAKLDLCIPATQASSPEKQSASVLAQPLANRQQQRAMAAAAGIQNGLRPALERLQRLLQQQSEKTPPSRQSPRS